MANITHDQIAAALKKLGPVSPGELADHLQVERSALGHHLKPLLDAGSIKATGSTINRRVALPDQKFDTPDAPPQERKKKRKGKMAKPAKAKPAAPKPAPAPDGDFLTAITADSRLVIFVPGSTRPLVFTEDQTERVAELMYANYRA